MGLVADLVVLGNVEEGQNLEYELGVCGNSVEELESGVMVVLLMKSSKLILKEWRSNIHC